MKSLDQITIKRKQPIFKKGLDGITRKEIQLTYSPLTVKTINPWKRIVHVIADYFVLSILFHLINLIPFINRESQILISLALLILYPLFYTLTEFYFQQTPGKFITNTIVINKFAEKPNFQTCLLRTLIRFVPFYVYSCFSDPSRGWHDRWSDTYVVQKDYLPKLKKLLDEHNQDKP